MSARESGWPFLVARGRRHDYRTVLAPQFLVREGQHGLLAEMPDGTGDHVRSVALNTAAAGPLTVVYDVAVVRDDEVGGRARDEHGRELEILYGLVLRGRGRSTAVDGDLGAARKQALRSYRRFLADEEGFGVDASLPVRGTVAEPVAYEPPPERRSRRPAFKPIALGGAALAVGLAAAVLVAARDRVPHYRVSVVPDDVECAQAARVPLTGGIEAEGGVTLRVRWRTPDGIVGVQELRAERGSVALVTGTYPLTLRENDRISLEATAPDGTTESAGFAVHCAVPPQFQERPT